MGDAARPGTPENPVALTDPRAMRALAHPARIKIWLHLIVRGSGTATECADVAGISPSACSYHLRALAKYGFVEEDLDSAADGRQRPWRARIVSFSIEDVSGNQAADLASRFLVEAVRADAEETRARYVARQSEYPKDWQQAAGEIMTGGYVTAAELMELRKRIQELVTPYARLEPANRPPGALPVQLMFDMFPWFGPEEAR